MSDKQNLINTIEGIDMFSVFARLMRTSGLKNTISGSGPLTIFVPTNDAFGKIPDKVMNGWLSEESQAMLRAVLSYHVVPAKLMAATLGNSTTSADSISGLRIGFTDRSGLKVNNAGIQARNIEATDGIIHALDTVLEPPAKADAARAGTTPAVAGDIAPAELQPGSDAPSIPERKIAASPEAKRKLS